MQNADCRMERVGTFGRWSFGVVRGSRRCFWILSRFPGVPHGEAKLVDFVRASCGADRETLGFRLREGDRIRRVLSVLSLEEGCGGDRSESDKR